MRRILPDSEFEVCVIRALLVLGHRFVVGNMACQHQLLENLIELTLPRSHSLGKSSSLPPLSAESSTVPSPIHISLFGQPSLASAATQQQRTALNRSSLFSLFAPFACVLQANEQSMELSENIANYFQLLSKFLQCKSSLERADVEELSTRFDSARFVHMFLPSVLANDHLLNSLFDVLGLIFQQPDALSKLAGPFLQALLANETDALYDDLFDGDAPDDATPTEESTEDSAPTEPADNASESGAASPTSTVFALALAGVSWYLMA